MSLYKIDQTAAADSDSAARVLTKAEKVDHINPVLRSLRWLPLCDRIDFKILVLVYKALDGLGQNTVLI